MPTPGEGSDRRRAPDGWEAYAGLAASALLHVVLIALFAMALRPSLPPAPPIESLAVELLSPAEMAALVPPAEPTEESPPVRAEPVVPPAPEPLRLAHAGTILSSDALDATARRSLTTLASAARFEQICDVEAMEQIAKRDNGFRPERAVAYATADTKVIGNVMIAAGAAFLSGGQWYRLSFRCETTPDRLTVTSFDFATGGIVTEGRGLGSATAD